MPDLGPNCPMTHQFRKLEDRFELKHVGSSLLNELAKGLYRPESVMREYIQNAIDAHKLWEIEFGQKLETPVQIEFRTNGISVIDYGIGMNLDEVRNVKSVAVSPKQVLDPALGLTGHKGVGIWAGLSFFEVLTLRTTKRGLPKGYQITLHFKKILDSINERTDIGTALNPNYEIHEYDENEEEHYTDVTLTNPLQSADWFLDYDSIYTAIKRICPCPIDPNFVFHDEVNDWYRNNGFETFPIKLDGNPVFRDYAGNVGDFTNDPIRIGENVVAQIWYAVSKKGMMRPTKNELIGFRIIQNGFVIKDDNPYSGPESGFDPISIAQYPSWFVGEIHVTSDDLHPNLARDDFTETELRRKFIQHIRKRYDELAVKCMILGKKRERERKYNEYQDALGRVVTRGLIGILASDTKQLKEILADLKRDESLAAQSKQGKAAKSAAPIDAVRDRDVRTKRKGLINHIETILKGQQSLPVTQEQEGLLDVSEDISDIRQELGTVDPQSDHESTLHPKIVSIVPSYTPRSLWADDGRQENSLSAKKVSIDVLLSLLEEVLEDILPSNRELAQRVISELRQRLQVIVNNND